MAKKRETLGGSVTAPRGELSRFLRQHRATIIAEWSEAVRNLSKARTLSTPAVVNHIPSLIDELANLAEQIAAGAPEAFPVDDAALHALQRLETGFDLEEVIYEYSALRRIIFGLVDAQGMTLHAGESQFLNAAIDAALSRAASGYAKAQQRIIQAMDRVSEVTLTATNSEEMLARLLQVFLETTAPVDTVVILLREGTTLRVRAAVGLDSPLRGRSLEIGEGFAGTIARERRPMAIQDVATNPIVVDPQFRQAGVKALYGVPLLDNGEVIGVAHMGSRSASEFSYEQQVLFRAMANRATLLMSHALTVARERAANVAARALARSGSLDDAATQLLAGIGEAFGWHAGVYWRVESGVLRYRDGWTSGALDLSAFHRCSREGEFAPGSGLPGRAWASGGVEWIADLEKDPALPRKIAAADAGLQSAIAFPLSTGDDTLGVLEFFSREPRVAVDEAVEMTAAMALHLPEFIRRVHAQDHLRQSEAQKAAMLEVALDCVITMNAGGQVVAWNPASERTFGYTAAEALGQELGNLIIPPELRGDHQSGLAHYLATGHTRYLNRRLEVPAQRRDGTRLVVELTITRVPVDGPPLFTGYLRDITGRKRIEEEQSRLFRQAEEASRMRERLLAIVAHDLRNPLGAVMSAAALLFNRADAAETRVRRPAEKILQASARMDRLIADLLDTANIHRGQLSIERLPHRLGAVVADAREQHAAMAAEKGIHLTAEISGDLEYVYDRDRILQVLANLIGNAVKFGRRGDAVCVRSFIRGDDVVIEVADTGPGISADDLPLIFEPYWSGRRDESHRQSQSTGLGLFISKGIIEAHGGRLWAESEPGRGTTFRFALPLVEEA